MTEDENPRKHEDWLLPDDDEEEEAPEPDDGDGGGDGNDGDSGAAATQSAGYGGIGLWSGIGFLGLSIGERQSEKLMKGFEGADDREGAAELLLAEIDHIFVSVNAAYQNRLGKYVGLLACVNYELREADIDERLNAYSEMITTLFEAVYKAPDPQPEAEALVRKLDEYLPTLAAYRRI